MPILQLKAAAFKQRIPRSAGCCAHASSPIIVHSGDISVAYSSGAVKNGLQSNKAILCCRDAAGVKTTGHATLLDRWGLCCLAPDSSSCFKRYLVVLCKHAAGLQAHASKPVCPFASGPPGFNAAKDTQDSYQFIYPFGWQEVSVDGTDVVYKDIIEPLESASVTISKTDKSSVTDFGNPLEVSFGSDGTCNSDSQAVCVSNESCHQCSALSCGLTCHAGWTFLMHAWGLSPASESE